MASLLNTQINNTFPGLLKTESNGPITPSLFNITDGLGNESGLQIDLGANQLRFGNGTGQTNFMVLNADQNNSNNTPINPSPLNSITGLLIRDTNDITTASIVQDGYGSTYYDNWNEDFFQSHIFRGRGQGGTQRPGKIQIDSFNSPNNSDNWFTSYQTRIEDMTYNSGTGDLTLVRDAGYRPNLVVNIPTGGGGAAGLISGGGTDSMESAGTLTTNPADAQSTNDICLGNGSFTNGSGNSIMLGAAGQASDGSVAIGSGSVAVDNSSAYGGNSRAVGTRSVGIGRATDTSGNYSIGIGGEGTTVSGINAIGIGSFVTSNQQNGIVLGDSSTVTAVGAVAIGSQVTGGIADTVSIKALEVQTDSTPTAGGIIMSDAGGTDRRINIDATGALQIDSTPVGGGGGGGNTAFSSGSFTMSGPSTGDAIGGSVLIPAGSFTNGDVLEISGIISKINTTGWQYLQYRIQPDNTTIFGGFGIGSNQSSNTGTNIGIYSKKTLAIDDVSGLTEHTDGWIDQNNAFAQHRNVDWTVDQYLVFYYYIDDAASSCLVSNLSIAKIN